MEVSSKQEAEARTACDAQIWKELKVATDTPATICAAIAGYLQTRSQSTIPAPSLQMV